MSRSTLTDWFVTSGALLQRLICFSLFGVALSCPAGAAEMKYEKLTDNQAAIFIDGEVVPADVERFRHLALKSPEAVVVLNSTGGAILAAMEIGRTLRIAGFSTSVPRGGVCASACALIWLAGTPRELIGQVGFHAAYREVRGSSQESGAGNALVGNYLTQLGLSANAILFATSAPPDRILWLTRANKEAAGIEFKTPPPPIRIGPAQPPAIVTSLPPSIGPRRHPVTILGAEPFPIKDDPALTLYTFRYLGFTLERMASSAGPPEDALGEFIDAQIKEDEGWLFYGISGQEASRVFWSLDTKSISRNADSIEVWVKEDHEHNKDTSFRTALSYYRVLCKTNYIAQDEYIEYDKNGLDVTSESFPIKPSRIIPGSMDALLRETIC